MLNGLITINISNGKYLCQYGDVSHVANFSKIGHRLQTKYMRLNIIKRFHCAERRASTGFAYGDQAIT